MKHSKKSSTIATKAEPRPSYLESSRGSDDLSQYGEASDVVKWVAAMRSLNTSIPTIPSAPESPVASTDENSLPEMFPRLFDEALSIAPFASMVPAPWGHPDDTRKTGLPRPASSSRDYDPPFIPMPEMQDAIFEVGTSMLIYAINMGIRDAKNCDYEARRSFGPRREVFSSSDEVVREIANSCPLAYTCRRSRAAVFRMLRRLMQSSGQSSIHGPDAGVSILKYIHVTVKIGNLVATEELKRESETPPDTKCIRGSLGTIVGLRSRWLYDNPLITVTDVRTRCAEIPNYLMEYVDRIETEWWFNRDTRGENAHLGSDVLWESVRMFRQARHITITPCMPLMSAAQLVNKRDIVKGKYWLRNPWTEPEEIAIAKLRQWKRYDGILKGLWHTRKLWMYFARAFASSESEMYVTEYFPLPIFEIRSMKERAR
ncbi:hypothetical protein CKAH01_17355 [Colletotrichum kahawae]|uniref:Uncharacterized protein n=1 Tax=Colletotrichum kahawae TaxID=34407 RepID=A0AAD9YBN8_COLKA|nr:hypothetical protein CKAH01_17355 [Colletotrichum kahawae]